ncbi:MAG TPA: MFS transporter [Polyangiaceae bacterium]|nr:MFS transporter [Polyangiaceae bacterium]
MSPETGREPPRRRGPRLVSIAIASALFMEFIDSTALSTALPTLARAFRTDPVHLKLALTSYLLALAVFAPASGWVADRFGPKRVFMTAMVVFLAGSVLCGSSRSLGQLVACRLLQGAGGAMMTPVARLIIVGATPRAELVSAMAWFTVPALVGPLLGPPLAGLILGVADWPWIFYVNAPVCLAGLAAVARLVPDERPPPPGPFDARGFALAALAISALVGATETFGVDVAPPAAQAAAVAVALAAAAAYVRHARASPRPVLDLSLFGVPTFRASLVGGTIVRLGIGAGPLLVPLLLQVALGWTPLKAGLVSIWQSVGALGAKPGAAPLLRRYGFRAVLMATIVGTAVVTALPGFYRPGMPVPLLVAVFVVAGFVRSNHFTAANTFAYADVPPARVSAASTLATVTQQIGLSLGVSFGGAVLHLTKGGGAALAPERFTAPFVAVGAVTLLALPLYGRLPASAGASLRGEPPGR